MIIITVTAGIPTIIIIIIKIPEQATGEAVITMGKSEMRSATVR